jgi:ribosomal protein S30
MWEGKKKAHTPKIVKKKKKNIQCKNHINLYFFFF